MVDNRKIVCPGRIIAVIISVTKISHRHKAITFRADSEEKVAVPANVVPHRDVGGSGEIIDSNKAVGRQRRPSAITISVPPAYPCRCPRITGHPAPACSGKINPPAIVIRRPAPGLIRNPCPSLVGIGPISFRIGRPIGVIHIGLPNVAVITALDPSPLTRQIVIKCLKRCALILALILVLTGR